MGNAVCAATNTFRAHRAGQGERQTRDREKVGPLVPLTEPEVVVREIVALLPG
ncbi:hypothetical protein [Streptomyces sp. SID13726]|uniref:hypothetical protein n=1 Tax=Streptomyces sp. SID13726 TaxID=2706058 RepID=UPI0019424D3D|nr:hypothetical protein [Streptomyces sp. SID13726]